MYSKILLSCLGHCSSGRGLNSICQIQLEPRHPLTHVTQQLEPKVNGMNNHDTMGYWLGERIHRMSYFDEQQQDVIELNADTYCMHYTSELYIMGWEDTLPD